MSSCRMMSLRVILSAVAVSATMGTSGKNLRSDLSWVYSGRKSCPHCEMQCASSMANSEILMSRSRKLISPSSRSGEMYSSFTFPCRQACFSCRLVVSSLALLMAYAGMPFACSASTWSFIREMRGDMTMAVPSVISAGSWKQMDFPPPVGMSASVSFFCRMVEMISSCSGRNPVYPK